jgi:hypothetical protein
MATLLTFVHEVPFLNFSQATDYSDWRLRDISQSLQENAEIVVKLITRPLPSTSFSIHWSLIILAFHPELLTTPLNKSFIYRL